MTKYQTEVEAQARARQMTESHGGHYRYDAVMAPDCTYSIAIVQGNQLIGWL